MESGTGAGPIDFSGSLPFSAPRREGRFGEGYRNSRGSVIFPVRAEAAAVAAEAR